MIEIEFNRIKEIWAGFALTQKAKEEIASQIRGERVDDHASKVLFDLRMKIQQMEEVKLQVKAAELYPEAYDMSIVLDSVENRKKRHDMGRKYTKERIDYSEE